MIIDERKYSDLIGGTVGARYEPMKTAAHCQKCGKYITKADEPKLWFVDDYLKGAVCKKCAVPQKVPVEEFR